MTTTTPNRRGGARPGAGRPKGVVATATVARRHAEEAVEALATVVRSGRDEGARVLAAVALLEAASPGGALAHRIAEIARAAGLAARR